MKTIKYILIAFLLFTNAYAQEYEKTKELFRLVTGQSFNVVQTYNDNKLVDERYYLFAQNGKYQYITDIITVYSGTKQGFEEYIDQLSNALEKYDVDTSLTIGNTRVVIFKSMGAKFIRVNTDDGYTWFGKHEIKRIKKKLLKIKK